MIIKNSLLLLSILFLASCSKQWVDTFTSNDLNSYEEVPIDMSKVSSSPPIILKNSATASETQIAPVREALPNVIYVSMTTSASVVAVGDVILWNGVKLSSDATPVYKVDAIYIGRIDVVGTNEIIPTVMASIATATSAVTHKYSVDNSRTYTPRLIGASKHGATEIVFAYQIGNIVQISRVDTSTGAITPIKNVLSAGNAVTQEYEMLGLHTNSGTSILPSNCPGGGDFVSDGTNQMAIAFNRGYQLPVDPNKDLKPLEQRLMGQPFGRFSVYDSAGTIIQEEKKSIYTNRTCYDSIAYNEKLGAFGILSYSLADNFRFAMVKSKENTTKQIFLKNKDYSTIAPKNLVGFSAFPKGFILMLNYTDLNLLKKYDRARPAVAFFTITKDGITPATDSPGSVSFVFNSDLENETYSPKATVAIDSGGGKKTTVMLMSNYLMELNDAGKITKGPTQINDDIFGMHGGDKMFYFGSSKTDIGWVYYDKNNFSNVIRVYRYKVY